MHVRMPPVPVCKCRKNLVIDDKNMNYCLLRFLNKPLGLYIVVIFLRVYIINFIGYYID